MYDMIKEELRNIEEFPDYWVSNKGNFYSTRLSPRTNPNCEFYKLKLWDKHPSGYINVGMYNEPGHKNKTYFRAHRVVWESFKGEIPEGYVVDHINSNKKDNRLENLQLLTWQENILKYHRVDKLKKKK
jgi:hypothetical protein